MLETIFFVCAQGLIDIEKEVKKLQDKITRLEKDNTKLAEAAAKPDYVTKVPEAVRTEKAQKVCTKKKRYSGPWLNRTCWDRQNSFDLIDFRFIR